MEDKNKAPSREAVLMAPCEGGPILPDSCSDCRREGTPCAIAALVQQGAAQARSWSEMSDGEIYEEVSKRAAQAQAGDVARDAVDWPEFVRRAKLIYEDGDEGMQALDYLLALVDAAMAAPATSGGGNG